MIESIPIVGKAIDEIISRVLQKYDETAKTKNEFNSIVSQILNLVVINDLPVLLKTLRSFILENELQKNKVIKLFFVKWLNDPLIATGISALNAIPNDRLAEFYEDLHNLKI